MFQKHFNKSSLTAIAMATAVAYAPASNAALAYSNDFESFVSGDIPGFAIGNIVNGGGGWFVGAPAPGDYNNGYSRIVSGEGDVPQGNNVVSSFSDYNSWSPFTAGAGTTIQAFLTTDVGNITADMLGNTYSFSFDGKIPGCPGEGFTNGVNCDPSSQAEAFIKVLDQDNDFIELATRSLTAIWI